MVSLVYKGEQNLGEWSRSEKFTLEKPITVEKGFFSSIRKQVDILALPPASYSQTHHALEMALAPTSFIMHLRWFKPGLILGCYGVQTTIKVVSISHGFMSFFAHRYKESHTMSNLIDCKCELFF
ncbi:hypothetical protein MRB53_005920 [Persea americana]|uniref:Uncharacterized protein n=1 Tax=Persea americana TaxID=3435 RepID=A0ACC2MEH4_PERAE|nr:hypothetical protein MRB53_005920 [Persea americana]